MRSRRPVNTLALLAAVGLLGFPGQNLQALDAEAPSLTGQWVVTVESDMGTFYLTWNLTQHEDGSVTGSMHMPEIGPAEIGGGSVDGDAFELYLVVNMQGQTVDVAYRGTFTADELTATLNAMGGQFTADVSGVREEGGAR